ncbi:MAG: M56 family metallopeptidase [Verrucomicrobiales bacterium]|nr:M56 family metallopeptidase [Verrucomicrobiales bacterium]
MNTLFSALNDLGDLGVAMAWPWAVQVSLLVGLLWLLERGLGRHLRPSVRHALWLLVPLKLWLPPTIAFPTGIGYWINPTESAQAEVTAPATASQRTFMPAPRDVRSAAPRLTHWWTLRPAGLAAAVWVFGLTAFMAGILFHGFRLRSRLSRAVVPDPELAAMLARSLLQAQRKARFWGAVRLVLIEDNQSPVLWGCWRPVILLPRGLLDRLSPEQFEAVLVHELVHARRGDAWIHCVQTITQALWWWHPLVWFASSRLRAAREEVVDDTTVSDLDATAIDYASTLVKVARALDEGRVARASQVGMLGSRRQFSSRIHRLLELRFPVRTDMGRRGSLGVLLAGLLLVPMAGGGLIGCEKQQAPSTSATALTSGVDLVARRKAVLLNARQTVAISSELHHLFPAGSDQILEAGHEWRYVFEAGLHDRYLFSASVDLTVDTNTQNVTGSGTPSLHIVEMALISPFTDGTVGFASYPTNEIQITTDGWRQLVESKGNFDTLGYQMTTNRPVAHFREAYPGIGKVQR